jgi:hypothetical protein
MVNIAHLGESMKKEQIAPRTAFSSWQFSIGLYYIFHAFLKTKYHFESQI